MPEDFISLKVLWVITRWGCWRTLLHCKSSPFSQRTMLIIKPVILVSFRPPGHKEINSHADWVVNWPGAYKDMQHWQQCGKCQKVAKLRNTTRKKHHALHTLLVTEGELCWTARGDCQIWTMPRITQGLATWMQRCTSAYKMDTVLEQSPLHILSSLVRMGGSPTMHGLTFTMSEGYWTHS